MPLRVRFDTPCDNINDTDMSLRTAMALTQLNPNNIKQILLPFGAEDRRSRRGGERGLVPAPKPKKISLTQFSQLCENQWNSSFILCTWDDLQSVAYSAPCSQPQT